jgi:hypothetical protein
MKKIVCFMMLFCGAQTAIVFAQNAPFVPEILTTPWHAEETQKYENVNGSPYLVDNWAKGIVKLSNGQTFKNVDLKYDQVEQQLVFKANGGKLFNFTDTVKEFKVSYLVDNKIEEKYFRSGYIGNKKAFYEVITDGRIQFLKFTAKVIKNNHGYGESDKVKSLDVTDYYYFYKDDKLIRVKRDDKSVLAAMGDKEGEMEHYVAGNKLNMKKSEDIAKAVMHYNSI